MPNAWFPATNGSCDMKEHVVVAEIIVSFSDRFLFDLVPSHGGAESGICSTEMIWEEDVVLQAYDNVSNQISLPSTGIIIVPSPS